MSNEMSLNLSLFPIAHHRKQFCRVAHQRRSYYLCTRFKFDNAPIVGEKPDYERIKARAMRVLALLVDSLHAHLPLAPQRTRSTRDAAGCLTSATDVKNAHCWNVLCFPYCTLESFIEFGNKMGRRVVILGRKDDEILRC